MKLELCFDLNICKRDLISALYICLQLHLHPCPLPIQLLCNPITLMDKYSGWPGPALDDHIPHSNNLTRKLEIWNKFCISWEPRESGWTYHTKILLFSLPLFESKYYNKPMRTDMGYEHAWRIILTDCGISLIPVYSKAVLSFTL